MSRLYKYRLYCTTDEKWEYIWAENAPTTCPTNVSHTVNSNSIGALEDIKSGLITDADSPYLLQRTAVICDTTSGNITINLPKVSRNKLVYLVIHKRVAANTVTIDPAGSETIDGNSTLDITSATTSVVLESDGTEWNTVTLNPTTQIIDIEDIIISEAKGDIMIDNGEEIGRLALGTNGQILRVDTSEELGVKWYSRQYLQLINIGGAIEFSSNKSWTNIYWDTEVKKDSIYTHSEIDTNGDITINKTGWFEFCIDVSTEHTKGGNRTVSEIKLNQNGSEIPGTKSVFYNRTSGYGHNSCSINRLVYATSGDSFRVQGRIISGSGRIRTYANGCRLMIKEII